MAEIKSESKLVQSIRDILDKEGMAGYIIRDIPENRTAEVSLNSCDKIIIRGRDSIDVREKKLKEFVSSISIMENRLKHNSDSKPVSEDSQEKPKEEVVEIAKPSQEAKDTSVANNTMNPENISHIEEGRIVFDLIITEKNGKKYYTCPCNQTYDQKGHAKWNHIKRHLNRKQKK